MRRLYSLCLNALDKLNYATVDFLRRLLPEYKLLADVRPPAIHDELMERIATQAAAHVARNQWHSGELREQ